MVRVKAGESRTELMGAKVGSVVLQEVGEGQVTVKEVTGQVEGGESDGAYVAK